VFPLFPDSIFRLLLYVMSMLPCPKAKLPTNLERFCSWRASASLRLASRISSNCLCRIVRQRYGVFDRLTYSFHHFRLYLALFLRIHHGQYGHHALLREGSVFCPRVSAKACPYLIVYKNFALLFPSWLFNSCRRNHIQFWNSQLFLGVYPFLRFRRPGGPLGFNLRRLGR
jgi:hypothetical protein